MAMAQKQKPKPHVVERPKESIVIQIHQRRRDPKGKLQATGSRSVTVYNLTLDEVHNRILKAVKE
jgi:hypothetical protein